MIDKNDVKMPVQRGKVEDYTDEQIKNIEDLLDLVNAAENKQELRLGEDYYKNFNWFGNSARNSKSYFSYQEEAVYDFIFNLNKSGILSDQVGMGKTIEAGMIISELASRKELKSLLIIVPNEIMSEKWKSELEDKFGIRPFTDSHGEYPSVTVIRNYDEFCLSVFDCLKHDRFGELVEYKFRHEYREKSSDTLESVIASFVKSDIKKVVEMINGSFEMDGMKERVEFDGKRFKLKGTDLYRDYSYDADGVIRKFLNERINQNIGVLVRNERFYRDYVDKQLKVELRSLYTLIGDYFVTCGNGKFDMSSMTSLMAQRHPILVVPISYAGADGTQIEFLNRKLVSQAKNYRHKFIVKDYKEDKLVEAFEEYRIIDFFIDVGYQTMIVDEVHDYINVDSKINREKFHKLEDEVSKSVKSGSKFEGKLYPSAEYDRFELFDEYYFIKKSSLYKKLKSLADKANRKIFLTATPIKSDMVDFYLLTLLASNKDAEAYKKLQGNLDEAIFIDENGKQKDKETVISDLYNSFTLCLNDAAKDFSSFSNVYFAEEEAEDGTAVAGRYKYPYFNNSFLLEHHHSEKDIRDYIMSYANYMSIEELVMELMLAYNAETATENSPVETDAKKLIGKLTELLNTPGKLQTRIVFRALLNNTVKLRFEEDFTSNGKPIKRIRELLEQQDGPRRWNKTYRKYGIRHTRHQTYNLADCEHLDKLSPNRIERYQNLPLWPRRNGKVIFLVRDDVFFDCFLNVQRKREETKDAEIKIEDLPNYEQLAADLDKSDERLKYATAIFDYINDSMSGGDENHLPHSSKYESVDIDDSGMVEYKLALVNRLMTGSDAKLGSINNKVLLFAENGREEILDWFRYQGILKEDERVYPMGVKLDPAKEKIYTKKWLSYNVDKAVGWKVSTDTADLSREGNVLIIIDPKRYEKGVDMQKADTIINFDINYDPLKMEQRIGRIDRIRPKGAGQSIQIISFVPLNDMSGFVINFFANEMRMFTQWMGETTGIVSVPEEVDGENKKAGEGDISFEGRVQTLEEYYKGIYNICTTDVNKATLDKLVDKFVGFFGLNNQITKYDFEFLQVLRSSFDKAYRNSLSPLGGHSIDDNPNKKVVRFNSSYGLFVACLSDKCDKCKGKEMCNRGNKINNNYSEFAQGVKDFFKTGADYYQRAYNNYMSQLNERKVGSSDIMIDDMRLDQWLKYRNEEFEREGKRVCAMLESHDAPYPMPMSKYRDIFEPMKKLYWDSVVNNYLQPILEKFHAQCDSVLDGAKMFERFIKTFSIADFMNNMKGTV